MNILSPDPESEVLAHVHATPGSFLQSTRLTAPEIAGLAELSLALHRV
jgi:hypothetical protein